MLIGTDERKCSWSMIIPIDAILFDIDGTLCDSDPLHHYAFRQLLQEEGYHGGIPISEEFIIENISGKNNDEIGDFLFPGDHQKAVKFMEDEEAMFRRLASKQLSPVKGFGKICKWVEDHNLKRAAVTNAPREDAELILSILGLSDFFQLLIVGSECARAKPFPDPYLKALEILGASANNSLVFEDSVTGIKAAVAAGIPVIGLTTRNPDKLLLGAKPAFLIRDFDDPKLWMALEEVENLARGEGTPF